MVHIGSKNIFKNMYICTIPNGSKMGKTQIHIRNKYIVVCLYCGVQHSNENKCVLTAVTPQLHGWILSEISQTKKEYIWFDSICLEFKNTQN